MQADGFGVLLEDLQSKLDQVLEATEALSTVPGDLKALVDRMERVEAQTELLPAIRAAVTDQSRELKQHDKRITALEQAA